MSRVVVAGSNKVIEPVIEKLHELNLLHVVNYSGDDESFGMGKPVGKSSEYAEQLIKLRSIERYLEITDKMPDKQFSTDQVISQMGGVLGSIGDEVIATAERISEIDNEVKIKQDQAKSLKPLAALPLNLELLYGYDSLAAFVGTVSSPVEADVSKVSYVNEVFSAGSAAATAVAVFVPGEKAGEVSAILSEHGFSEISVPRGLTGSIAGAISALESDAKRLEGEKAPLQKKLKDIRAQHEDLILAIDEYISIQSQKAESPLRFASTESAFVIDGWLPTDQFDMVKKELEGAAGGRVQVEMLDSSEAEKFVEGGEDIPTKMNNPKVVRPFELITRLFAIPEYKEFDPTPLIFVFFPVMFGLILGDVGYGIIIFVVMLLLRRKFRTPGWQSLISIVLISSIWAIIFGILFGEFFGPLGLWAYIFSSSHHVGLLGTVANPYAIGTSFGPEFYGPLGRIGPEIAGFAGPVFPMFRLETASVLLLIGISLFIGVLHTGVGSILGVKNELAYGKKDHAYFERLPVLLFQVFFVVGLLGMILGGLTHPLVILSGFVLVVSIGMMVKGPEGIMGVTHVPFFVSNLISYLRLLAIGLASVGVAFAANQLAFYVAMPMLSGGGHDGFTTIAIVVGIVVLITVHFINLLLGILSPFMHPLRLHYVEMFTKFYSGHGGGVEYSPFGRVRRFLRD
ncbi:V-type ATP synthase subunit I [Candidatus Methanocrinis natronophilus]|uniref:A-type ATP synthase subunit I n=1 Tax=Candidatus Methanocrinis natronophilus TaxID=3033396 RepID=A0ABT5X7B4_9EURY|nr:V-type ATP synthase subunit I [Candidatus Methanocrinis natronophilus]MDF0590581.1 V-type ATP synthase subunit I [Candidatus Methanocrinis natronophilus]